VLACATVTLGDLVSWSDEESVWFFLRLASVIATVPGSADCTRAAILGASPKTSAQHVAECRSAESIGKLASASFR
jgi:hypothetical protein